MNTDLIITLAIIAVALIYVIRSFRTQKKSACCGCSGGCNSGGGIKQHPSRSCSDC